MRILLVIHGPEPIDSGRAMALLIWLRTRGEVMAAMGGTTGVAAVIDAGLEDAIDTTCRGLPSSMIISMAREFDEVILLNEGRSRESALRFGGIIKERLMGSVSIPVTLVERDFLCCLIPGSDLIVPMGLSFGLQSNHLPLNGRSPRNDERIVGPLTPGDPVWVNGNVIGHASEDHIVIRVRDQVPQFSGLLVKEAGLARVKGPWDLETMLIRGGRIDRKNITPRWKEMPVTDRIRIIDHDAEGHFHSIRDEGIRPSYAVTIGDDTTRTASCLLYRLNVPILGITDGDEDGIMVEDTFHPDSIILRLAPHNDDGLGALLRKRFLSRPPTSSDMPLNRLASLAEDLAGNALLSIRTREGWSDVSVSDR